MKKLCLLWALLVAPTFATASGFGWYANTVSADFFNSLVQGTAPSKQDPYRDKVSQFIAESVKDNNFPTLI